MRDVIYHTPLHVKKEKVGESQIFFKNEVPSILLDSLGEKTGVGGYGAQNSFANAIVTQDSPRCERRRINK
jgi:hypothetical protein